MDRTGGAKSFSGLREESSCRRCGTCCRLGGPVLHGEDLSLVSPWGKSQERSFGLADLMTLRKGELARDDVAGTLAPLDAECVKLAPAPESPDWTCRFLDRDEGAPSGHDAVCRIHAGRPAQCRALSCTDTRSITELYARDRVTRRDLLQASGAPEAWQELPDAHEERCSIRHLTELACAVPWGHAACAEREELVHLLRFDAAFRQLCVEKGRIPQDCLPFLLGRPLVALLSGFGLRLEQHGSTQKLVRIEKGSYAPSGEPVKS